MSRLSEMCSDNCGVTLKARNLIREVLESPKSDPRSVKALKSVLKSVKILYSEKRPGIWCHIYVFGGRFQLFWLLCIYIYIYGPRAVAIPMSAVQREA